MTWNDIQDSVFFRRSLGRQRRRRRLFIVGFSIVSTAVAFALISPGSWAQAPKVDLSPANWPPGEFERYSELHYNYDLPRLQGTGRRALIAGTSSALAVRAGLEALKQGGSAADAALVTAMAQITLSAGCCMSFAGDYALTYYEAATGRVHYLDASMATLLREDDPMSIPTRGTPSGRTALVPGFMAGAGATHERFGVLPWPSLFEPSIYFAEEGFPLEQFLANAIAYRSDVLTRLPETRKIFTSPDGDLYQVGEIFKQPALARTLRRFAKRGAEDMYTGVWAKKFLKAVRAEGSKMIQRDLRRYQPAWGDLVRHRYRDCVLYLPGEPADGGELVRWILKRLAGKDLAEMGHYTQSPESLYHIMKALRDFFIHFSSSQAAASHTDSVVVIDEEGNVAAAQYSIYTLLWGTTGIFVGGVSIPDTASLLQWQIQEVGPGQLLPSLGNALIALRDGRPVLTTASIGSVIAVTVQALVDMIDYGNTPRQAQDAPTIRMPYARDPRYPIRVTAGAFAPGLLDAVRAMGMPILEEPIGLETAVGAWSGLIVKPKGRLLGATSNLYNGWAVGY